MTLQQPSPIERVEQGYAVGVSVIFFISGALYLGFGHWTITHHDFWRIYEVCLNRNWMASAILKYNGHSHFWPSQIWLADLRFFAGDQELLFWMGFCLQLLSAALLITPVWRDSTVTDSQRLSAIAILVVATFWMGRASMTASGGFNCCYSLTLCGAALLFFCLPRFRASDGKLIQLVLLTVGGGFLATFSFGTGLVIWPTIFYLGFCLRLPPRFYFTSTLAAAAAILIFASLPGREGSPLLPSLSSASFLSTLFRLLYYFCRLLGNPFFHATGAWLAGKPEDHAGLQITSFWFGSAGILLGTGIVLSRVFRRDLRGGLDSIGLGLVSFNLMALAFIAIGRAEHIRVIPAELNAPRYLFWSSLFWGGLLLVLIRRCLENPWLRRSAVFFVFAVPVFLLPSQYQQGLRWRLIRQVGDTAGISLVNNVRDERKVSILFPSSDKVYTVARLLKQRRLDMFAVGLHELIGKSEIDVFLGKPAAFRIKGSCWVDAYIKAQDGALAVRIKGWATEGHRAARRELVVVDSSGKICGIGRTFANDGFITRLLYSKRFGHGSLVAYISHYDPDLDYFVRVVDNGRLSAEKILIATPEPP
jgi:hypothetical protein